MAYIIRLVTLSSKTAPEKVILHKKEKLKGCH